MRKAPTRGEGLVWREVRRKALGVRFRRQAPLYGYIADFYCPSLSLVVEIDGSSHEKKEAYDKERDRQLAYYGLKTVRISEEDACRSPRATMVALVDKELAGYTKT